MLLIPRLCRARSTAFLNGRVQASKLFPQNQISRSTRWQPMATVSMALVKQLREATGAPILDCKNALSAVVAEQADASESDTREQAIEWLRRKGVSTAAKKSGRKATEGLVGFKLNESRTEGVIVEINSETDFVSKNERFQSFVADYADICLHDVGSPAELPTAMTNCISTVSLEGLAQKNFPGTDKILEDAMTDIVTSIRENIKAKRATKLIGGEGATIGGYVHQAVYPAITGSDGKEVMLGRIAGLVSVEGPEKSAEELNTIAKNLAMHIVAANPRYLNRDVVPGEVVDKEKDILREQATNSGKDPKIVEKMLLGQMNKVYEDLCLFDQQYMIDTGDGKAPKVSKFLKDNGVTVNGFVRFQCGELDAQN